MKAKNINILLMALLSIILLACEKRDYIDGTPSPYMAIQDVRMIHKGQDVQLSEDKLLGAEKIVGVVISDNLERNIPEGIVILQQVKRGSLWGIALNVGNLSENFKVGDSLIVNVRDKMLKRDKGFLYVDALNSTDVSKVAEGKTVYGVRTTGYTINLRPEAFESTLVSIAGGEMYPRPDGVETFSGTKLMINGADTLFINTQPSALFANMVVPRNINVSGIMLMGTGANAGRAGIWPLRGSQIVDISDPEIPGDLGDMPIVISGFCNDPSGGDGNYEYIQLLANADIDFSEIPFSLVTSNNAGTVLHTAGWATGGAKTYKFNLTEGSVRKGEFFYVGGSQMRINGANSTPISDANWIRVIQTANVAGDGLGNANANILPNSGNAGGIALFVGTNISESSVPIDVVFYGGTATASIISPDLLFGYRITNNDLYATYSQETGELTPFFSMGEGVNDFRFPHHGGPTNTDIGYYYKLGGKFSTSQREWIEPRTHTLVLLDKSSAIAEIESGEGLTEQVD